MHAILNEGSNSNLEDLIDTLQAMLKMKMGYAAIINLGQRQGMVLTRCAFVVMITMSGRKNKLFELLADFEMMCGDIEEEGP